MGGFMVAMVGLVRAWLKRNMLLSTLSYVSHVIVMMIVYNQLITLAYIIQLVRSLQAHEDRSSLLRRLSSTLYVTLTNLEYFW